MANVVMKFKDAPIGARFKFIDNLPERVYVKIHANGDGLVVQWNGNVPGRQSHCCWLDKENGYDFDTEIELVENSFSVQDFLEYEIRSSIWASFIFWDWGQNLSVKYFAWKVGRKYHRYLKSIELQKHYAKP